MYHPQNQRIAERSTYSESVGQDEQNDTQHRWFSLSLTILVSKSAIFALDFTFKREILHAVQWILKWSTYSESAGQDEQNDTQHRCFSSSLTILVSKSAIFPLDFTFEREILHAVQWILEWSTYSESASQDEQNDTQHRWFSSSLTILVSKSAIFALDFTFEREILHAVQWILKWSTYSESASQDEQNDTQHQCCSSSAKMLVLKSAIFALDFTFEREILHDVQWTLEWSTYSESASQDEQHDTQHRWFSSSLTILVSISAIFALDYSTSGFVPWRVIRC